MSNISDIIEKFILEALGKDNALNLSRNELAQHFGCAPSQINYVLSTRFSLPRGYVIESQRGGGGFVKISRLDFNTNAYLKKLVFNLIGEQIDFRQATYLINTLIENSLINKDEAKTILFCLTDKALSNPFKLENKLRANILKNYVLSLIKGGE